MKTLILIAALGMPISAAGDTTAFYYAECLRDAAIVNAMPNADGSKSDVPTRC